MLVLFDADEGCVAQAEAMGRKTHAQTISVPYFIGGDDAETCFHINHDPFTSSAYPPNAAFSDYYVNSQGTDYVLGEVTRPGYYRLPVDMSVSDAIMSAGGPTQRADMPKTIVRRRSHVLLSSTAVRDALAVGTTLDQLNLEAGDELVVNGKQDRNWMNVVQIASLVAGLVLSVAASRRF